MASYAMDENLRPSEFGSTDQLGTAYGGSTDKLNSVLHGSSAAPVSEKVPRKSRKPICELHSMSRGKRKRAFRACGSRACGAKLS